MEMRIITTIAICGALVSIYTLVVDWAGSCGYARIRRPWSLCLWSCRLAASAKPSIDSRRHAGGGA